MAPTRLWLMTCVGPPDWPMTAMPLRDMEACAASSYFSGGTRGANLPEGPLRKKGEPSDRWGPWIQVAEMRTVGCSGARAVPSARLPGGNGKIFEILASAPL